MAQGLGAGARQETAEVDVVRAAGGIVVRRDGDEAQILLVHRPRGDWTFPKGKAEPNESDEDTALREVEEETGLACVLGAPAGETQYQDAADRPKVARYWFMEARTVAHTFTPNHEIDDVRWCTRDEADGLLSYEQDRQLLGSFPEGLSWALGQG
jgi:8-oxo-dGTP pyrophosphatase MutT (NUDIX family)